MPTPKQMEKLGNAPQVTPPVSPTPGPADNIPEAYWDAVLLDPSGRARAVPIRQLRLGEISQYLLRLGCRRCDRVLKIQTSDAVRLYGAETTWKDAGRRLLDSKCENRTGSHEEDGCWPSFE